MCMSVRGDRAQGRTYPHPGSIFFRNSHFSESLLPLKRHRGEPTHTHGTHGRTRAHESHRTHQDARTSQDHNSRTIQTHQHTRTTARPHDRAKTESAADSTAAAPEPNAPHGRLPVGTVPAPPESFYRYSTGTVPCVSTRLPPVSLPGLAVESAAVSAVAWSCGGVVGFGWL